MSQDLYTEQKGLSYEEALFEAQRCLICYQEMQCEALCVRNKQNAPVKIGLIERFIGDHYASKPLVRPKEKFKVAILGSGPASLACAQHLLENGVQVELFEKSSQLGGVLTHGIPPYRLPNSIVEKHLQQLFDLGMVYHLNTNIHTQNDFEMFLKDRYEAIFLGIGASMVNMSKIKGADGDKVIGWKAFLNLLNLGYEHFHQHFSHVKSIVVMVGGNVAMDVAISAAKFGIETHIVYRRGIEHMPARSSEIKEAITLGVFLHEFRDPYKIEALNDQELLVMSHRTELIEDLQTHKTSVVSSADVSTLKTNMFVMAIGSKVKALHFDHLQKNTQDQILVNEQYETSIANVFAAGDGVTGPKTVIHALASGKLAAQSILERLKYEG